MFLAQIRLLAKYNQMMNRQLFGVAARLSSEDLAIDRGAYFRSISGTFNHIYVADIIWLQRFAGHPTQHLALLAIADLERPDFLDKILYADFLELSQARETLDQTILDWVAEIAEPDLHYFLPYQNMRGEQRQHRFGDLLLHFFNHQTHHRGQVTTLLSQVGLDVGVTDLLPYLEIHA